MKKMLLYSIIIFFIMLNIVGGIAYHSFFIVNPGEIVLHMRLGKVIATHEQSGCYTKMPFIDSIITVNNRICKTVIETTALSKDLQFVSIGVAINYKIDNAVKLYQTVGTNFEQVIIDPFAQESIKAVVAKYTAEDLIQYRHDAKDKVFNELRERLLPLHISLIDFNFVHSDFSPDFIKAVEEKQIAEQSAKTARNLTEKVKEEALQIKSKADEEAYSLKVKKETVTADLIALKKAEALLKAIEKWDGKLPHVAGSTTPLLNLSDI